MDQGEGLLIPKCTSVHTWGMRIPIDIVFLKRGQRSFVVTSLHSKVQPWKVLPITDLSSTDVLELPSGRVQQCNLQIGEEICIS